MNCSQRLVTLLFLVAMAMGCNALLGIEDRVLANSDAFAGSFPTGGGAGEDTSSASAGAAGQGGSDAGANAFVGESGASVGAGGYSGEPASSAGA